MVRSAHWRLVLLLTSSLGLAFACGGNPNVTSAADGAAGMAGGGGNPTDGGGMGNIINQPDGSAAAGGTGGANNPCANLQCGNDQHCEAEDGGTGVCVGNTCSDLDCGGAGVCILTDGGAFCDDISCTGDVDCPIDQFCNGSICVDDVCAAGDRTCSGQELLECDPNGGGTSTKFSCGSANPRFTSMCTDPGAGNATCPCEDDWDCPNFTDCEVESCEGTGVQPTCSLPPEPFTNVLPTNEITWGGTQADPNVTTSVFPASGQVVMSPVVANLDDDNGDGLIDERDFPEIIFTTFCGTVSGADRYQRYGILRAIHGGGPNKGGDYFANCDGKQWFEGDAITSPTCGCQEGDLDSTASLAVADLDDNGVPEIIALTWSAGNDGAVQIYDNRGAILATSAVFAQGGQDAGPSIANVDGSGLAEINVGRSLLTIGKDMMGNFVFLDRFEGAEDHGTNGPQGPVACIADVIEGDNGRMEIGTGASLYRYPVGPAGANSRADCTGSETGDEAEWCNGNLVTVWHAPTEAVNAGNTVTGEGFCAIADILGSDQDAAPGPGNPLDGQPEMLSVTNGFVQVFNSQTGELKRRINMNAGNNGGPPNIDDFDGDGFPEVGTAAATAYVMIDFQDPTTGAECDPWPTSPPDDMTSVESVNTTRSPPGMSCTQASDCGDIAKFGCNVTTSQCVCLHNGWRRTTEDSSSRVTGSTLFDFNGDGAAEVVYNDECMFRIYDGINGDVLFNQNSESRTRIEYPVVVDVDNDGNAEIVFATSNESGFCDGDGDVMAIEDLYNNGIEVWGDAGDFWVSARRIWNQHAYHVTNITEGARVPQFEPKSWVPLNGRFYNTYRSQPRAFGVAPDLVPTDIQISSPNAVCGTLSNQIEITVEIRNEGDLRVGPGVEIGFEGQWDSVPLTEPLLDGAGMPLRASITSSLEPGDVTLITVAYDAANNSPNALPDRVRVIVDDGPGASGRERECIEDNNDLVEDVDPGTAQPDISLQIGVPTGCPAPGVPTTVCNDGSAPASNIVIRYFAGDPNQGGTLIHEETVAGPLAPGMCTSITATMSNFPGGREILIFGVADPDDVILECNDANNTDAADMKIICGQIF